MDPNVSLVHHQENGIIQSINAFVLVLNQSGTKIFNNVNALLASMDLIVQLVLYRENGMIKLAHAIVLHQ